MELCLDGGCACGSVRYECTAEPILAFNCHCRACQKAAGSGYVPYIWVYSEVLHVKAGEPRYHASETDNGRILERGFCPECGSILFARPYKPEIMLIVASSLDDPSVYEPELELWTSTAQPWDVLNPKLRQFRTQFTDEELLQLARF
jgi:hypothetical protein